MSSTLITIGQITEMQPGTKDAPVWINDEFEAIVSNVQTKAAGAKTFYLATLQDPHSPNISVDATFWTAGIPAKQGKVCHFSGQGIKLEDYKGNLKLSIGDKALIRVVGSAPGAAQRPAAGAGAPAQRQAAPAAGPLVINGATVGMAINQAIGVIKDSVTGDGMNSLEGYFLTPAFSRDLHALASDIIRVAAMLEKGNLAAPVKARTAAPAPAPEPEPEPARAAPPSRRVPPAPDGINVQLPDDGEDVPF